MAGSNAAWIAAGMEAEVIVVDTNLDRLRFIDQIHKGRIITLMSDRLTLEQRVREADVVIGSVLVPGARAPKLITADMIRSMRTGAVAMSMMGVLEPTLTNGMGRGIVPGGHELLVTKARSVALGGADLVVVVGTPLDFRLGYGVFGGKEGIIRELRRESWLIQIRRLAELPMTNDPAEDLVRVGIDGLGNRGLRDLDEGFRGGGSAAAGPSLGGRSGVLGHAHSMLGVRTAASLRHVSSTFSCCLSGGHGASLPPQGRPSRPVGPQIEAVANPHGTAAPGHTARVRRLPPGAAPDPTLHVPPPHRRRGRR